MDRYLSTLLFVVVASSCSRDAASSHTTWNQRESADESRFARAEAPMERPDRTSEMRLPQHRQSDEIASTTLPDLVRPNSPAAQTTAGGLPGMQRADDPTSPNADIMPGDRQKGGAAPILPMERKRNDLKITQELRQMLFDSTALSFSSKSVRVTTHNGEVTLSGKVPSARERSLILRFTKAHAGVLKVNNEMEVSNK